MLFKAMTQPPCILDLLPWPLLTARSRTSEEEACAHTDLHKEGLPSQESCMNEVSIG